jgi:hypothetical protein
VRRATWVINFYSLRRANLISRRRQCFPRRERRIFLFLKIIINLLLIIVIVVVIRGRDCGGGIRVLHIKFTALYNTEKKRKPLSHASRKHEKAATSRLLRLLVLRTGKHNTIRAMCRAI